MSHAKLNIKILVNPYHDMETLLTFVDMVIRLKLSFKILLGKDDLASARRPLIITIFYGQKSKCPGYKHTSTRVVESHPLQRSGSASA